MDSLARGEITRSEDEREQLAKEWLLRILEETPLAEVEGLPVSWITAEAPRLIGEILGALGDHSGEQALAPARAERAERLARMRKGTEAAKRIPRDLAALQTLLIESIRRDVPERRSGDFAAAVSRLAEVFGTIQGAVTANLVEERSGGSALDELTGLPGPVHLDEWIRLLLAEHRRYGHGFALALIDIEGLDKINQAYGRPAGDRMVSAIAGVIRRQVRACDQAFRVADGEFAVLAPHTDADGLVPMAERTAALIADAQVPEGPRIAIAAGIAACPADGRTAEHLIGRAEEATYEAKASGRPVSSEPNGGEQNR